MPGPGKLTIFPSIFTHRDPAGRVVLTRKFIGGVSEYARHWPEGVQVLIEEGNPGDDLDHVSIDPADLPFELHIVPYQASPLSPFLERSAVALLAAFYRQIPLGALCARLGVPAVYTTEYSLRTRLQILGTERLNPLVRARRILWQFQEERRQRRAFRQAAGLQCNGTPTFDAYRSINSNALLYFDTRVTQSMLADEQTVRQRTARLLQKNAPIRLAFSGRLIPMKGADHLIPVAEHLRRMNIPFTLSICGAGALEKQMRAEVVAKKLENHVLFRGSLDFKKELLPFITNEVDLFVCCHRQGDPSCTYLETMSCGVPIVGYANDAFAGLVDRSSAGWTSPMNHPRALAGRIAQLATRPEEICEHALRSLAFASNHPFGRDVRHAHLPSACRHAICRTGTGTEGFRSGTGIDPLQPLKQRAKSVRYSEFFGIFGTFSRFARQCIRR